MSKKIVFTFGRFNPPSIGHKKLIDKVMSYARSKRADHAIFASKSHDSSKNPLPYSQKTRLLKKLFPGANIVENHNNQLFDMVRNFVKQGYDDVTLIVGADRVNQMRSDIGKYVKKPTAKDFDPAKHYPIRWTVISAGERDPNATGVEGMSGSKLRQLAKAGEFTEFLKGVPTKNVMLAKTIYNQVRQNLKEQVEVVREQTIINEGVNDPSIFKAVFLAGGPGSGKDYIMKQTLLGLGLVELNSDIAFEFLMKRENLDMKMPDREMSKRNLVRGRAKNITLDKTRLAIVGRLGLIINGTADDVEDIKAYKSRLESMGYDTMMVFVNTSNEVSQYRNIMRGQLGGRTVPENIRSDKWNASQANLEAFKKVFGWGKFVVVDNSTDTTAAAPTIQQQIKQNLDKVYKHVYKFVKQPVTKLAARRWIESNRNIREHAGFEGTDQLVLNRVRVTPGQEKADAPTSRKFDKYIVKPTLKDIRKRIQ